MAFWGVEVKPGNPFTHIFDGLKGRLHVSMATLGNGTATKKSTLQCNVGNKSPVYLCSLFPEKAESLQINVEFEECEEVIFSVLGPRSVHLSGHYLPRHQHHNFDDDNSESYGEDIANSETKVSVDSEEDKYEDSFINDDDPEVFPASPVLDSEEELLDEHKPHNGKGHRRRLRKMYQVSKSEVEGEDDDRCLISSLYKTKSSTRNTTEEVEEKVDKRAADTTTSNETEDGVFNATETMNDADDVDVDGQLKRRFDQPVDTFLPSSEEGLEIGGTPKKNRKERPDDKAFESGFREKEDEAQNDDTKVENKTQNLCVEDGQERKVANHISALEGLDDFSKPSTEVNLENDGKLKKKRKERPEDKALKAGILEKEDEKAQKDDTRAKNRMQNLCVEDGQEQIVANHIAPEGPDDFPKPSTEVNLENGGKLKKKWKERPKDKALEKVDEAQKDDTRAQIQTQILCVMDGQEQKVAKHISVPEGPDDLSKPSIEVNLENGERPKKKRKKRVEGKILEVVCTNLDDVVKEDKGQQDVARGGICPDLPVRSEQNQQSAKDGNSGHDSGRFVDGQSDEKKVKKKKKKSKTEAHEVAGNTDVPLLSAEDNANGKSSQVKTFPSGLRIEELEAGKPDGKVATSGKKISVHYVGKLKENGKVMDSTDGSAPYRFRLGKGEVIDGWDVGIDGMRVGEKRRLVIPPSLAYGSKGDGAGIPPNSWLEYDIELVKAR